MVERTDDHPGTGSATYCSAVSLRQASRTLVLAQRSYANNATTSSCMVISPGLGHGHYRYCRADNPGLRSCSSFLWASGRIIGTNETLVLLTPPDTRFPSAPLTSSASVFSPWSSRIAWCQH